MTEPTTPPTEQQLDEIQTAIDTYRRHPSTGFACCTAHPVADAGAALLAEVRRLRTELATEQRSHGDTIDDRDQAQAIADKLAYAVAPEGVIGEHSSMNCPWTNALDLITPKAEVDKLRTELAAVHAFLDEQERAARLFELPTPAWVEAVRAASAPPAAPLSASHASSASEAAQSPTGASEGAPRASGALEPEVPLPDRLEAVLAERFTELGNPFSRMRIAFQGPDGWPASKEVGPRDVAEVLRELLAVTTEDLAAADNPTHLRWGLNDVLWSDDDSVIVLLSGPDLEPYWLELDPERAAVLREDLAGPDGAPHRTLTPNEYDAAWHAVDHATVHADPGTVLHAVLDRLGIEWQDADQPTA